MKTEKQLKEEIFQKVVEFYYIKNKEKQFIAGETQINYAGRVYDYNEMLNLIDASLDFWLTAGPYTEKFEKKLTTYLGVKYCSVVNSGSSANLIAISALTSPKLRDRQLKPGDEIITVAGGFPTTVAPIIQNGLIPVFLDLSLPTYNIDCSFLEEAKSEKTKAVFVAHTLGNPFEIDKIKFFCEKYNLWFIEDNCDALGSKYKGAFTGTFGDIATQSFYPPHHITMGEGGAVITSNPLLKQIVESFRDWGRDCWCPSGHDNTCCKRFGHLSGDLPLGYDHKYTYSHFGYNLKATDLQASIGCAQINKLNSFTLARQKNFTYLYNNLKDLEEFFILPEATDGSIPSWFGFTLSIKKDVDFKRDEIVRFLENNKIQTRMLFAGNIIKQPCFNELRINKVGYRVVSSLKDTLPITDYIMNNTFWLGVYPGLSIEKIDYMIEKIKEFCKK